jgi:hypothetical protein
MGIQVEFNPDLALRNMKEFLEGRRANEECIPQELKEGHTYSFLKEGQRNYYLDGEIPLLETQGQQKLSRPKASIKIIEATHYKKEEKTYTKGTYKVIEVFKDEKIHFEGFERTKPSQNQ